jgi:hypothetical protein
MYVCIICMYVRGVGGSYFFFHLHLCAGIISGEITTRAYMEWGFFFTQIIIFFLFLRTLQVIGIMDLDGQKLDGTARYLGGVRALT